MKTESTQPKGNKMKSIVFVVMTLLAMPTVAQDANAGKTKYASCAACHGAQGQGGVGPKLAGKPAAEIEKKLIAYKNKQQVGQQSQLMWGLAAGLSPADIKDLAAYTATLK